MNLVFLITVVVEDFSNQRTPHQLRVSVFDLKQERRGDEIRTVIPLFKTVVTRRMLVASCPLKVRPKRSSKAWQKSSQPNGYI